MEDRSAGKYQNKVWTIPNVMSMFRLLLVPLFCWTYLRLDNMKLTVGILILSALTDLADGWIARHYQMISDVGKVLDPFADKITEAAMLICLLVTYPVMTPVFVLLAIKELSDVLTGYLVMQRTGTVLAAEWHGKASTVLLYITIGLHILWRAFPQWGPIPRGLSLTLVAVCCSILVLSMILYAVRNIQTLKKAKKREQ